MKSITTICLTSVICLSGCQDELDVINPNEPALDALATREALIDFAQGALYVNGLQMSGFGGYHGIILGHHERMGDIVTSAIANFDMDRVTCPDLVTLDDGSTLASINPDGHKGFMRATNNPTRPGNPQTPEWAQMYGLNGAMNHLLYYIEENDLTEDERETLRAWAFFWKGFAYSRIGSMYIAGIINNEAGVATGVFGKSNNKYVSSTETLAEAELNFAAAEAILLTLGSSPEYSDLLAQLIPSVCQTGKGFAPTATQWIRGINTLRARNILVNTYADSMTPEQWDQVLAYSMQGLQQTDNTFTVRVDPLFNLVNPFGIQASVAGGTIGGAANGGGVNKISERLIQDFKPGDKRFTNNFNKMSAPYVGPTDRGTSMNTRYLIVNGGKGMAGVVVYASNVVGAQEIYFASTYEENVLMLAEANIYKGNIDAGLAYVDELRTYQGAGLAPVTGTGLTLDQAREELRRERRVALAFRGHSFYDARRWHVLETGRTGCTVVDFKGVVHTNARIDYNYFEYWDVPVAESFYNPPSPDSAPIVGPD